MTATQKRIIINKVALAFSTLSAIIALGFLFWILAVLVTKGVHALNWNIFIFEGSPPGYAESGLKHALVGQLILVGLATLIGVPLGILAGTYLSEYGKSSKLAHTIRDISDIMMSAGNTGAEEPPGITALSFLPSFMPPAISKSLANGVPIGTS